MKLNADTLSALTLPFDATGYLRIIWDDYRATPTGMGDGKTRFASPDDSFKLLYAARDLATAIAETIVRDRFERRRKRQLMEEELDQRAIASLVCTTKLRLLDLRGSGTNRLGVSTDVVRGKSQRPGRSFSARLYRESSLDGIIYASRITNDDCVAVYDRAAAKLDPNCPVADLCALADLVPALDALDVEVIARAGR
ncbi:RES family NAD+ phosphorylase [Sphingosinicella sp. YJ22]|uniref:RES family NAD+ phosphorylase n=1 Tax=Sphingosinicella sp. YJ22 TaxID=1104780 RepID=UPI00140BF97E|nr:RES family NAD+ phosphorylase [Sphingosinicella sp. YJ22]